MDGGRRPHWVQMPGMAGDTEALLWLVKGISGSSRSTRNQPLSDCKAVARSGAPRPHTCGQSAAKAADQFVQKVQLTELGPRQDSRHARKPVGSGPVSAVGAGSDGAADRDPPAPLGINRTSGAILAGGTRNARAISLARVRGSSPWPCTSCDLGFLARVERAKVFRFAAVPSPAGALASALTPHPDVGDIQANLLCLFVVGKVS